MAGEPVFEVLVETERVGVGTGAAKGDGDAGVGMLLPLVEGCVEFNLGAFP